MCCNAQSAQCAMEMQAISHQLGPDTQSWFGFQWASGRGGGGADWKTHTTIFSGGRLCTAPYGALVGGA